MPGDFVTSLVTKKNQNLLLSSTGCATVLSILYTFQQYENGDGFEFRFFEKKTPLTLKKTVYMLLKKLYQYHY